MGNETEEIVDAEVVHETGMVVPESIGQSFWPSDPGLMMTVAVAQATALADIIQSQNMSTRIGKKDHINIEGWQTLGAMVGVFASVQWTKELLNEDGTNAGWEARALATTPDGKTVGAAEAECRRTEKTWKTRDSYALRSMAQTRAQSKALRGPLGFIVHIAGYSATPEEEMVTVLTPYQQVGKLAIELAGGRDAGKQAYLDACAAAGVESVETEDDADKVITALQDAFPDAVYGDAS